MSEVLGTPSVERQGFEPLLLLEGVTKSYDGWSKALDDVSLSVARGEFVSIIGCSGAGKSTLLRCVNRLIDPTQGSVVFDGAPHLLDEAAIADIYGTNEEAEAGSDFGERSVRQVGELSGSRTREADPERLGKAEAKDSSSPEVAA